MALRDINIDNVEHGCVNTVVKGWDVSVARIGDGNWVARIYSPLDEDSDAVVTLACIDELSNITAAKHEVADAIAESSITAKLAVKLAIASGEAYPDVKDLI